MVEKTVQVKGWDEKTARNGSKYLVFHFDGDESYAVFNAQVAAVLKDSATAQITLEQKGEFTNLVAATMLTKVDASVQSKIGEEVGIAIPEARGNGRERAIKKQVALKAAAAIFESEVSRYSSAENFDSRALSMDILVLADKFLEWLEAE